MPARVPRRAAEEGGRERGGDRDRLPAVPGPRTTRCPGRDRTRSGTVGRVVVVRRPPRNRSPARVRRPPGRRRGAGRPARGARGLVLRTGFGTAVVDPSRTRGVFVRCGLPLRASTVSISAVRADPAINHTSTLHPGRLPWESASPRCGRVGGSWTAHERHREVGHRRLSPVRVARTRPGPARRRVGRAPRGAPAAPRQRPVRLRVPGPGGGGPGHRASLPALRRARVTEVSLTGVHARRGRPVAAATRSAP